MIAHNDIKAVIEIVTECCMSKGPISPEAKECFIGFASKLGEPARAVLGLVIEWGDMNSIDTKGGPFPAGFNSPLAQMILEDTKHNIRKYPSNQFREVVRSLFLGAKETEDLELLITPWVVIQVVLLEDDSIKFNSIKKTASDFLLSPNLTRYDKLVRWFRNL